MVIFNKVILFFVITIIFGIPLCFSDSTMLLKREHELVNENFEVILEVSDFNFYGCTRGILYVMQGYVLQCKRHTYSHHFHNVTATLLLKRFKSNNYSKDYYYLCIEHDFCYAVQVVEIK